MRFADCVPVFLYDPVHAVVGMVHAGWPGTIKRAAGLAVETMRKKYGTKPVDILAAIGPSIGPHHYQVGPEVVEQVIKAFGEDAQSLLQQSFNDSPLGLYLRLAAVCECANIMRVGTAILGPRD
jgi:copper oxidase (laccase) domain-containing protein